MNLARLESRMCFALVFTAIVAHCIAQHAILLVLVSGMLAVGSRYVCEGPRGLTLPRPISLLLTAIVMVITAINIIAQPGNALPWIGTFVVWLTIFKLYEERSVENEAERLILSLLLMVLAALLSIDLLFGILLVAWTGMGITVLLLFQLYHGQELVLLERRTVVGSGDLEPSMSKPVSGLGARRDFRRMSMLVLVAILIMSGLFFIGFPRAWTGGLARAATGRAGEAVSGHSSQVDLVGGTRINNSLLEVLSVTLENSAGDIVQLAEPLRLRGSTLDHYSGGGLWVPSELARADWRNDIEAGRWHTLQTTREFELESDRVLTQRFDLAVALEDLFSISVPISIRAPVDVELEYNSYTQVLQAAGALAPLQYEIRAVPGQPQGLPAPMTWNRYRNEEVATEARRLLAEAGLPTRRPRTPAEASAWNRQASEVFRQALVSGRYRYSLDLTRIGREPVGGMDPVEYFLLVDRVGHCEYFAAAFVSMCHTVDIHARMVTGFVTDRYDELTNRYIVLEADAHAWGEVELSPGDWLTVDPTPAAFTPIGRSEATTFSQRLQWIYRWAEGAWRTSFLGFDEGSQATAMATWLPWWSKAASAVFQWAKESLVTLNLAFGFGGVGYIWFGIVLLIIAMGLLVWRRTLRHRRKVLELVARPDATGREARSIERDLGFYVDMLKRLDASGFRKPAWQPPRDWADSLEQESDALSRLVGRLVGRFYAIRFGACATGDVDEIQEDLRMLDDVLEGRR